MENRPVDPGSIQESHRSISFTRIKHRTRANDNLCKCLMYHAACNFVSWVSTIHTVVLTADVFQLFIKFGANQQYVFEYPAGKSGVPVLVPGCWCLPRSLTEALHMSTLPLDAPYPIPARDIVFTPRLCLQSSQFRSPSFSTWASLTILDFHRQLLSHSDLSILPCSSP